MKKEMVATTILGASDGAFTGLGLILGLVSGLSTTGLWHVALTTAVAGATSMGAGVVAGDNDSGAREGLVMGLTWAVMCLLPVVTAASGAGWPVVPLEMVGLGLVMSRLRDSSWDRRGLLRTFGLMVVVAVPTAVTAVLV